MGSCRAHRSKSSATSAAEVDYLKDVIVDDSLGLAAELEAQMQHVVDTYQCEWKTAVTTP